MTRPEHSIKYMQASFKKYQILAILFALLTAVASLFAALSGMQINALKKAQTDVTMSEKANQKKRDDAALQVQESLKQQIAAVQEQLNTEKQNNKNLQLKVGDLKNQLDTSEAKLHACQQKPAVSKPEQMAPAAPASSEKAKSPPPPEATEKIAPPENQINNPQSGQ
ncbi:MAG: hypothetical protein M0036_23135 [Desulfobacteraceae bacterium]|nr:hypothetical protein [Desulfobacteraceae bacterium]